MSDDKISEAEKTILLNTFLNILGDPELLVDYTDEHDHASISDTVHTLVEKVLELGGLKYLLKLSENLKKDLELI